MRAKQTKKVGKIIPHGVKPAPHELDTILFFTEMGKDVELIPPSNTKNAKNADFIMDGIVWEAKSPEGNSRSTMEHVFQKAAKQSHNIIIDLRRTRISDQISLRQLNNLFNKFKSVRRLLIITKENKLISMAKN